MLPKEGKRANPGFTLAHLTAIVVAANVFLSGERIVQTARIAAWPLH